MRRIIDPCSICVEEQCGGKRTCNCETCSQQKECNKFLSATVRITTKCTQSCGHCCFSCSPKSNDFMTIEMAEKISKFAENNGVRYFNIMGGEFYCHPEWKEILHILIPSVQIARVVSNGDWYETQKEEILDFFKKYNNVHISISDDKWHTNKFSKQAQEYLQSNNIISNIGTGILKDEGLVPIGRAQYEYSFYSFMGSYCSKPDSKYSFLIDEKGEIYKCGFGVWNYADVDSYMTDFRPRFKEVGMNFEKTFIPSCKSCYRSYLNNKD